MKQFRGILISLLLVTGVFLLILNSCSKDEDNSALTDIDGNVYHTVTIGTQVWMVENLKTTKYNDGSAIPLETDPELWKNLDTDAYCWYENDINNRNLYGALYNWNAVISGKLCPTGWHVPSAEEWTTLRDFLGGETVAGGKLKEKGTTHWNSPNTEATDDFGFKVLPAGQRYQSGEFVYEGINSNNWTTTIGPNTQPFGIRLYCDSKIFHMSEFNKNRGLSVRCIKD